MLFLILCLCFTSVASHTVGITMLKKHTSAAIAHHTLYMYQSMTHSAHWKPLLLFTDSDQYNVSGTHTFYNYTYDVMSLDLVTSDNVDTVIESCTNVGRGFQRKFPNIHIVYFNQGPDFFHFDEHVSGR